MAAGTCRYTPAAPLLRDLAERPIKATTLYLALGDAIVRLGVAQEGTRESISWCLSRHNPMLADGAFRAVAMLHLTPASEVIDMILDHVQPLAPSNGLRFWPTAAAAGWSATRVRAFLKECATSPQAGLVHTALASLDGKHQKHHLL
ncbi:hypothetical protein [Kitasatospora sp. MAA19]|uniref:hypothetical protein n=1 Tax=Kitasatospora sp. MAA19 TaxID=3035090 RepID=UPI0024771B7A|nr:hypothetical protein [Kitasatospora sp. MAA19]